MVGVLYTQMHSNAILYTRIFVPKAISTSHMTGTIKPFPNLGSGGAELAASLPIDRIGKGVVVMAIVSAGVPGAVEVAKRLEAPLDLVIIRRLLAPQGPGSQAVAATVAGNLVIDKQIGERPPTPQTPFDYFREEVLNLLALRTALCRAERPPLELAGKPILIVDCAMRTGLTMKAAIESVRTLDPASITAAVPLTSDDGRRLVEPLADELIYLAAPEPFGNAGVWYKIFVGWRMTLSVSF